MKIDVLLINFSRKNSILFKEYLSKDLYNVKSIEYNNKISITEHKANIIIIDNTNRDSNLNLKSVFNFEDDEFLRNTAIFLYGELEDIDKKILSYFDDVIEVTHDAHLIKAKIFNMVKYYLEIRDAKLHHKFDNMNFSQIEKSDDCRVIFISDEMKIPYEIADNIRDKVLSIEYALFGNYYESFLREYPYNFDLIIINGVDNIHQLIFFFSQIKSHTSLKNAQIIFVKKPTDLIFLADIINLGINNYINYPIDKKEVLFQLKIQLRNKKYLDALKQNITNQANSSWIDELTGLYNKKYLSHYFEYLGKTNSANQNLSLIMIDVDSFKEINDKYGHNIGDEVLRGVSLIIKREAKNNTVVRFGGDEFLIIISNHIVSSHDEDMRNKKVNKLITSIESSIKKTLFSSEKLEVHLSLGFSNSVNYDSFLEAIDKADKEMYRIKFERKQ